MCIRDRNTLKSKGVQVHTWPDEFLDTFKAAWEEVASEMSAEDEDFAKVWKSLSDFRETYKEWKSLGYLKD